MTPAGPTRPHGVRVSRLGLELSPSPDWSANRALVLTTLALGALVGVGLAVTDNSLPGIRDTDDAMRLVMVRDLAAGQGWFDQRIARLDPPFGAWMHWSRLLDGGVAGVMILFRQVMSPAAAEYWTRFVWPLMWIFPGVAAGLATARNLGGRSAVIVAAVLVAADAPLFRQFYPGRIDHHDVQIVMTAVAMACATARADRARWAAVGGAAAALGLAIGLEALAFQALIGASYGVALARDRREAGPARAYGLALAATSAVLFLVQTPPARWSMSFCDVLAVNLAAALVVAGLGLALAAQVSARGGAAARLGLLAAVGALAGAVYIGLDPRCLHGPFADMDPAVRPFWFDRIQEVQPLTRMMAMDREPALVAAIAMVMSVAAAAWLVARRWRSPGTAELLALAALIVATAIAVSAWRMQDYVFWIGVPTLAAAFSLLARRWLGDLMVPSLAIAIALSPAMIGLAADAAVGALAPAKAGSAGAAAKPAKSSCFAAKSYAALAALPAGEVLAPQDLGPFILVYTHHSAFAAPYHRMAAQILAAHRFFAAAPGQARALLPAPRPDYVVDCPGYPLMVGPGSLGAALRKGVTPAWLQVLSRPGAVLTIYKVARP
jgi:hypothetical protein